jgi:hypothetical protein
MTPEQSALLLAARKSKDPCWSMALNPTQRLCDESKARYRLIRGVNRGGKTAYSMWFLACCARRIHPTRSTNVAGTYVIFAPKRDQLNDPIAKKLYKDCELKVFPRIPFIPKREIANVYRTYGAGEPICSDVELKNGNRIKLKVSGVDDVWKGVAGKGNILGIVFDESAGSQKLIEEAYVRLLDANSNEQVVREAGGAWMLWGTTEDDFNPSLQWFKERCEDERIEDHEAFLLKPEDNESNVPMAERERLRGNLSGNEFAVRMLGEGSVGDELRVYPQWDTKAFTLATDYVPQTDDNIWFAIDPGANYTGMLAVAVGKAEPNVLHVVRAWQQQRTSTEDDIQTIISWLNGRFLEGVITDPAAKKVNKESKVVGSVAYQMRLMLEKAGVVIHQSVRSGDNRYCSTIPKCREYFEKKRVTLNPSLESMCFELGRQLSNVRFTSRSRELKESNIVKGMDHLSDALRYLISKRPYWNYREKKNVESTVPVEAVLVSEEEQRHLEMLERSRQHVAGRERNRRELARRRLGIAALF